MTDVLFERYKEALRAGHIAVLRGHLEDAAAAYRQAIAIAPDRAVPRTALGGVHLRLGDPEAAIEAYDGALELAPDDDPSLLGRAQALVVLRRTGEAAQAYDRLVEIRATSGRTGEASDAAQRALTIEPNDARRARHAAAAQGLVASPVEAIGQEHAASPAEEVIGAPVPAAEATLEPAVETPESAPEPEPAPAPEPAPTELPMPDPEMLVIAIDEATSRGDPGSAAAAALVAARAYRAQGHVIAAFDACLLGIGARPAEVELHLLLADLAIDRGWTGHAGDAYRSLLRLVELDGDPGRRAAVQAAAARLHGDPGP